MKNSIVYFCGDIAATKHSEAYFRSGDMSTLFEDILPLFQEADNVVVNLECALTEKETRIRKHGPNVKSPVETAEVMKKAGITACGLANNHSFDFGYAGLKDSFSALDAAGIDRFGAGHNEAEACAPYYFEAGGKRIAVVAVGEHEYTYAMCDLPGAAPFDPFDTLVRIRDAKRQADYLVVMYHGGKEQCEYPSPRLRKACHAFCDLGADLVLCQHSHIIGTLESYGNGKILYGQGNFHFVNYLDFRGWKTGLLVKATFGEEMEIELIPIESTDHGMRLVQGEEKDAMLNALAERSRSFEDGTWLDGWKAFVESKKEHYTNAVVNAGQGDDQETYDLAIEEFAHYLDCEAHTDVWRTLFPTWHAAGTTGAMQEA